VFTYACIVGAALLAAFSVKEYRFIALAVVVEFTLHKAAYLYAFTELRADNGWLIYLIYASIQLVVMTSLLKLKSHFVIIGLLFINMSYNLLTVLGYFYQEFASFYYIYPYFVGTIMIFELIYLGLLNNYVARYRNKHGRVDTDYIDSVFRIRTRDSSGGVA